MSFFRPSIGFALAASLAIVGQPTSAEPVPVLFQEGSVHGYLALRTLDGKILAAGELLQTVHGDQLTSRLTYRFRDGSIDDETAVFSQRGRFRLITDHRIQRGPAFPKPTDLHIDTASGEVTVRYRDKEGDKVEHTHLDLPPDLANGLLLDAIKNISPAAERTELSYLAATPRPRLIHLIIRPEGQERFQSAGVSQQSNRFSIHADLGGITGVLAPIIGKEPPDAHVWVGDGKVRAFIKSEQPLYLGGPLLRTELVSAVWSSPSPTR